MSKKSSSFKRKLKAKKIGFQYYRIWGWTLSDSNVKYHKEDENETTKVFEFNGQWIRLSVEKGIIGFGLCSDGKLESFSKQIPRSRHRDCINGSLTNTSFFKTRSQAIRELEMYASGCKTDGMPEMIEFHNSFDCMDDYYMDME